MTTTHTQPAGCDLDSLDSTALTKLAKIADRVDARGLFNAACDIRDWIQDAHAARAAQAPQGDTRQGAPAWGSVETVGDMVRNLLTLDQAALIYAAFHVDIAGERRCRTKPVTISRERVIDGKWVDSRRKDVPYAMIVWAKPDEAAPTCTPADERALYEAWELREAERRKGEPLTADEVQYVLKRWTRDPDTYELCPHHWPAFQAGLRARAAQGAGTAPVAVSQAVDVCTPCQGTGLVQHYLGGKTICLDCATHPAPVSTAAATTASAHPGCGHCNNPLFAGTRCDCGKVFSRAADGQQGASRAAPGELRSLLQEFVDYHTKPAGMTLEAALSTDKLGEFLVGVESREKEMVQRACAALALPAQGAVAASTDEPDWRGFLEMWAHDGALQTFSSRERFRKEATALARAPLPAPDDARLKVFIDWYLRDGKRAEVNPDGHMVRTTRADILAWLDRAAPTSASAQPAEGGA